MGGSGSQFLEPTSTGSTQLQIGAGDESRTRNDCNRGGVDGGGNCKSGICVNAGGDGHRGDCNLHGQQFLAAVLFLLQKLAVRRDGEHCSQHHKPAVDQAAQEEYNTSGQHNSPRKHATGLIVVAQFCAPTRAWPSCPPSSWRSSREPLISTDAVWASWS